LYNPPLNYVTRPPKHQ